MVWSLARKTDSALDPKEIEARVKRAVVDVLNKKVVLKPSDSFVSALGFNSLRMVSLSLALEEEFGRPLLLNDWISRSEDPRSLTVGSLCAYIGEVLGRDRG